MCSPKSSDVVSSSRNSQKSSVHSNAVDDAAVFDMVVVAAFEVSDTMIFLCFLIAAGRNFRTSGTLLHVGARLIISELSVDLLDDSNFWRRRSSFSIIDGLNKVHSLA